MANKEKIDYLLIDIRELEKLVAGMRDAEIYPASFFNQTFQLTHKVLKELHTLEEFQLEALRKQLEEHQRLIDSIPVSKPLQMPEVQPAPEVSPTIEVVQVQEPVVEEPIVVEPIVEKVIPEEKIVQETIPLKEIEVPHKTILADKSSISLNDILEKKVDPKYTLSDKLWIYLQNYAAKHRASGNGFGYGIAPIDGVSRTLSARYYKDGSEILIAQEGKNPRRLTPRECARLQGFPETFIIPVSDTQAYRQFGNSVVVPLMTNVAKLVVKKINAMEA
jgi:hypothetical protein